MMPHLYLRLAVLLQFAIKLEARSSKKPSISGLVTNIKRRPTCN